MSDSNTHVVVMGGGPGGYPAAFRCADLGMKVTLVDIEENPGGVCLYRGCIPSKALLHIAKVLNEAEESAQMGVTFAKPKIDVDKTRSWKNSVVQRLAGGLGRLSKPPILGPPAFLSSLNPSACSTRLRAWRSK